MTCVCDPLQVVCVVHCEAPCTWFEKIIPKSMQLESYLDKVSFFGAHGPLQEKCEQIVQFLELRLGTRTSFEPQSAANELQ